MANANDLFAQSGFLRVIIFEWLRKTTLSEMHFVEKFLHCFHYYFFGLIASIQKNDLDRYAYKSCK